jgi:DNA-binding transcriptional LysR family regulator
LRIRYIEIFYNVMQAGTVKGAANMLHITQPAATRLLQQAEQHVGVPLFQRVKQRLVPTAEALMLYPEVERMYLQLDAVRRMVATLRTGTDSMVRVLCVPALALDWLPRALGPWSQAHGHTQVSVRTLHSRQIVESLALREGDIGFAFEPAAHPALLNQPIARSRMVCVGKDLRGEAVPLATLGGQEVIDLDPGDPLGRLFHATCHLHDVKASSRVLAHSYHAAIEMAAAGLGWAIVDGFSAAYAKRHGDLRVLPIEPAIPVTVHAVRPTVSPSSAPIDRLIDQMQRVLAQQIPSYWSPSADSP